MPVTRYRKCVAVQTVTFKGKHLTPSKIVCVGRNYVAHIEELGNEVPDDMVVFLKPNSAISDTLHSQRDGEPLHYESELAFLVEGGQFVEEILGRILVALAHLSAPDEAVVPVRIAEQDSEYSHDTKKDVYDPVAPVRIAERDSEYSDGMKKRTIWSERYEKKEFTPGDERKHCR